MERRMYQLTEKQLRDADRYTGHMPTDDEIKARWAKSHHGKTTGWGMLKRNIALSNLTCSAEYVRGLWQGRVDKANGLDYSEQRNDNAYNLGYHRGYTEYESNRGGWDKATRERFDAQYVG